MISISAVKKLFQDEDLREVELAYRKFQEEKKKLGNFPMKIGKITIDGVEQSLKGVERKLLDKYDVVEETFHSEAKKLGLKFDKYGFLVKDDGKDESKKSISKSDAISLLEELEDPDYEPTEDEKRIIEEDKNFQTHKSNYIKPYREEYFEDIFDTLRGKGQLPLDSFYRIIRCSRNRYFETFLRNSFLDWCSKKPQKDKIAPKMVKIVQDRLILN